MEGYSFKIDEFGQKLNTCVACPANCRECKENNEKCDKFYCVEGFEVDDNGQCSKCPENCHSCQRYDTCNSCYSGYTNLGFECIKCPEHCQNCYNPLLCYECEKGYSLSSRNDDTYGQCLSCPSNCKTCNIQTLECFSCNEGYSIQIKDGKSDGKCSPCPTNCINCLSSDITQCTRCSSGYTNLDQSGSYTGNCYKCSDSNCQECTNPNECYICKEGYEVDYFQNSPNYMKCIPSEDNTECLVNNCSKCIYKNSNVCGQCIFGFELDKYCQCRKILDELQPDELLPVLVNFKENKCDDETKICTFNTDYYEKPDENHTLYLKIGTGFNEIIPKSIEIENTIDNFSIQINPGVSELEISLKKVDDNNPKFDIFLDTGSPVTLILHSSTRASLKHADGDITIKGGQNSEKVTINQIQPSSNNLRIIPENDITIEVVDFYSAQSLLVDTKNKKKVEIQDIKVQQKADAAISNAKIKGLIKFGLSSSLEIKDGVDLDSSSSLDIAYTDSQGQYDKAPFRGHITKAPGSIILNNRGEGYLTESNGFSIAESDTELNCNEWKIENNVTETKIKEFEYVCPPKEIREGKEVYRIYARGKNKDNPSKLEAPAIAGIVVGVVVVVGVVIFLLVYFLVIKKKKDNLSSENEAQNENEEDEV